MECEVVRNGWERAAETVKTKWEKLASGDLRLIAVACEQLLFKTSERYALSKDVGGNETADEGRKYINVPAHSERRSKARL